MRKTPPKAEDHRAPSHRPVVKAPTGISGFDHVTGGGLPEGRLSIIIGSPGSGKTIFALQTAVNRLVRTGETCIFVAFEESVDRILTNAAAFEWGADLDRTPGLHFIDARLPVGVVISGGFDLSALLAGLTSLKEEIGAGFIVFDAIDVLLSGLRDDWLESQELTRLEEWIRSSGVTAILTVKTFGSGDQDVRRTDLLQYMADCVVVLTRSLTETESSRSLCVQKYRGADFYANPVPMVISATGFEVVALRSDRSDYPVFTERVSTGIARLDGLINGGYRRGSSILISGTPGTSKTSLGASFVASACRRGERALLVSFDEGSAQIVENMDSIGLDLGTFVDSGLLALASLVSSGATPEAHFVRVRELIKTHRPTCLVVDPVSAVLKSGYPFSRAIVEALLDFAKSLGITVLCTSLLDKVAGDVEVSASHVSTIADTWIQVSYVARDGERNRALTIIKSRGTAHSNQVRELVLGFDGIDLVDVYVAEGEVLMGSARVQKEAEVVRQQTQAVAEGGLRRMTLEAEFTALDQQILTATLARDLKQKEIDFLASASRQRAIQSRAAAGQRLSLRRSSAEVALATTASHGVVS